MVVDDAGDIAGDGWGDDDDENVEDADLAADGRLNDTCVYVLNFLFVVKATFIYDLNVPFQVEMLKEVDGKWMMTWTYHQNLRDLFQLVLEDLVRMASSSHHPVDIHQPMDGHSEVSWQLIMSWLELLSQLLDCFMIR